jgi:hypothetical protein
MLSFPRGADTFGKHCYLKWPRPHPQWRPERGVWLETSALTRIFRPPALCWEAVRAQLTEKSLQAGCGRLTWTG